MLRSPIIAVRVLGHDEENLMRWYGGTRGGCVRHAVQLASESATLYRRQLSASPDS